MRRIPWLTLVVGCVTSAGLLVQELVPGTLHALERTPAGTWHEPWRWLTSLVVQDGWLIGGFSNVLGLVIVGVALEQLVSRTAWLTAYVGGGLVGQAFGHLWQPVGGGSSVAVCGLVGLLVVLVARGYDGDVPLARIAPPVWCGWLAAALLSPLLVVGACVGVLTNGPWRARAWSRWVLAGFCAACAVALLLDRDLHGGALTVAVLVAAVPGVVERAVRPGGPASTGR